MNIYTNTIINMVILKSLRLMILSVLFDTFLMVPNEKKIFFKYDRKQKSRFVKHENDFFKSTFVAKEFFF